MKIPNFKTEVGSVLYRDTVGRHLSPRVAGILLEQASQYLDDTTVSSVLDIGCGPGTISLSIAAGNPALCVTAVDSSAPMIELARTEAARLDLHNIEFQQMDAGSISFGAQQFDLALCNLAFPFFARPEESMDKIFSALRPGGRTCFTVPGRMTWDEFFQVATTVLGDAVSMARPFLAKFSQAEKLPDAMRTAGFDEICEQRVLLPFSFANGEAVLDFFAELFHLLDYATAGMRSEIADAIDARHPHGFTMYYEVVLLSARRPNGSRERRK